MSDQPITPSLNHFSIFAFSHDYWRLTSDDRGRMLSDWSEGLADAASAVHFYQTYPLECNGDLIVWSAMPASTPEAPAAFFDALARATNPHRRYVLEDTRIKVLVPYGVRHRSGVVREEHHVRWNGRRRNGEIVLGACLSAQHECRDAGEQCGGHGSSGHHSRPLEPAKNAI